MTLDDDDGDGKQERKGGKSRGEREEGRGETGSSSSFFGCWWVNDEFAAGRPCLY
jgi:hypothetical protein